MVSEKWVSFSIPARAVRISASFVTKLHLQKTIFFLYLLSFTPESQKSNPVADDDKIVIRISWMVTSASAVGNQYTLAVGVDLDGSEISVATFNVTVTARSDSAPAFVRSHHFYDLSMLCLRNF